MTINKMEAGDRPYDVTIVLNILKTAVSEIVLMLLFLTVPLSHEDYLYVASLPAKHPKVSISISQASVYSLSSEEDILLPVGNR